MSRKELAMVFVIAASIEGMWGSFHPFDPDVVQAAKRLRDRQLEKSENDLPTVSELNQCIEFIKAELNGHTQQRHATAAGDV